MWCIPTPNSKIVYSHPAKEQGSYCGWTKSGTTMKPWLKLLLVGTDRGIKRNIPGILRWCAMNFATIHSMCFLESPASRGVCADKLTSGFSRSGIGLPSTLAKRHATQRALALHLKRATSYRVPDKTSKLSLHGYVPF